MTKPGISSNNNVLRTSFPLFSASFVAQGINFLLLFLLPRFFTTSDIGHFFVFYAVAQILVPLVSLQSQNAIILSRSYRVAVSNLGMSMFIGIVFSFLLFISLLPFYYLEILFPANWFRWLMYVPLYVFLGSLMLTLEQFLTFLGKYKLMGSSRLFRAIVIFVFAVAGGWWLADGILIIMAFIVGQFAALGYLLIKVRIPITRLRLSRTMMKIFVLRHREILTFNTLITGLLMLTNHMPAIIISFFFGESIVAYYGIVQRVFSTLPGIWGQSVAQVFFRKCAGYYNSVKPFYFYVTDTFKRLLHWSVPYGIILAFIAPWFFQIFMGSQWSEAGVLARILMPIIVIQSITIPFTTLFTVLKTQRRIIWYYAAGFLVRIVLGFLLPVILFDIGYQFGLIIYSISGVLYYLVYLKELFGQVKKFDWNIENRIKQNGAIEK
jgi:O-antigen/teichoic acid export membrane protein